MNSKILKAVHASAKSLHDARIMNTVTMREFDALCLEPVKKMTPNQIKKLGYDRKSANQYLHHF